MVFKIKIKNIGKDENIKNIEVKQVKGEGL